MIDFNYNLMLDGVKVVVNDHKIPNRTLAKDVPVSEDFRVEVNKWMLDFFGYTPMIPDNQVYSVNGKLMCNAKTFEAIKKATL